MNSEARLHTVTPRKAAELRIPKKQDESPDEHIAAFGHRLIQVLDQREDLTVVLSALPLVSAAASRSMVGEATDRLETIAHGFVRTFLGIIARDVAAGETIH
jgi:hypothetical protein